MIEPLKPVSQSRKKMFYSFYCIRIKDSNNIPNLNYCIRYCSKKRDEMVDEFGIWSTEVKE